ncbi:3-oxo-5-alpha-steroid 4-dehydrogenase,C-terminal [Ostreococcus tauri]|nr:3-oxo-5-alpha-steroid 4-dehydrogenase,C-terminal [Ostreococcus tauri]CEF96985.1 3-oxo-5-alpha-steroid 4-dehydrogenase,C-terminal [Ostreococcus tauri]|eukprot:XP_022838417.1 3-oxo-5-alpha-steroid 4-dehydrogenase,C-terminal [Ostreococcus tauri]
MLSHANVLTGWIAVGAVTFPFLFTANAPYGKFLSKSWGPTMNGRVGWFLQEIISPPMLWVGLTRGADVFDDLGGGSIADEKYVRVLTVIWCAHYANRAIVYPATRTMGETAVATVVAAIAFNVFNGLLVGAELAHGCKRPSDFVICVGAATMAIGAWINISCDARLRALRAGRRSKREYVMPTGGLFDLVACPHYLGECIEWCGFAVLANFSPSTLAFAFWTFANLFPRAVATRRFYRARFKSYPARVRAMIPMLL